MVVHGRVAVLVQQLLHATERNGRQVTRVLELQQPQQVRRRLAAAHVHTLSVPRVQPAHTHGEGSRDTQDGMDNNGT